MPSDAERQGPRLLALRLTITAVALGLWAVDQLTKIWAVATLDPANPPTFLKGFLTLQLVRNPGAAFSLGSGLTPVFTVLAAGAVVYCIAFLAPRIRSWGGAVVAGLAIAGISGNLTDRLVRPPGFMHGHVIDFLQIPNWAIFNVADMCIVATAILVVLGTIREILTDRGPDGSEPHVDVDPADEAAAVEVADPVGTEHSAESGKADDGVSERTRESS